MALITFTDKVDSRIVNVASANKIVASDVNQLKDGVNTNEIDIATVVTALTETVKLTGDQTVAGIKTFTDNLIALTQANSTNNTTVATTAYVKNLIGQLPTGLALEGTWNAATDTPSLSTLTPSNGQFWIVSVKGNTNLSGETDWKVGDWAIYVVDGAGVNGWQKVDNSSVLDGAGTGQRLPLWSGSGDSVTLTNAPVTVSGTNVGIGGTNGTFIPSAALEVNNGTDQNIRVGVVGGEMSISSVTDNGTNDVLKIESSSIDFNTGAADFNSTVTASNGGFIGDVIGNSTTATTLETARNISGVSFNGSADISLDNANITNGAAYTTNTGTTTADNTQTFTNKLGSNSQWTNDANYTVNGAPASGSANYIQNQTAADQSASLRIDGSAQLGVSLTAPKAILGLEEIIVAKSKHETFVYEGTDPLFRHQTFYWNGSSYQSTEGYAFGIDALKNNVGHNSNAFGYEALQNNTGLYCSGFGYQALESNTGNYSNGFGYEALERNTQMYCNAFGNYSLQDNTGMFSSGFGNSALKANSGSLSNGFGMNALKDNTGSNANGFGFGALASNTGGNSNGFGSGALENNTGAFSNGLGYKVLENNTGAFSNGLGHEALQNNTGTISNGFGFKALETNTGGYSNGFGYESLQTNTGADSNGFGSQALQNNTGGNSSGFGHEVLRYNTGANSSGFAADSLRSNSGDNSNGFGYQSLQNNTASNSNGFGFKALKGNTGFSSSGFGHEALENNTGDNSSGFGYEVLQSNTGANVLALGYQAGITNSTANQFIVQQANINTTPLIQGDFATGNLTIAGSVTTEGLYANAGSVAGSILSASLAAGSNGTNLTAWITNDNVPTQNVTGFSYGSVTRAQSNSTFSEARLIGANAVGRYKGSGGITSTYGGYHESEHAGSGNADFITGTLSSASAYGSGTGTSNIIRGVDIIGRVDNSNHTNNFLQGAHISVEMSSGSTGDIAVNVLDFDYTAGTITGNFAYLEIENDDTSAVQGTAKAINSKSTLPSTFAGSVSATDGTFSGAVGVTITQGDFECTNGDLSAVNGSFSGVLEANNYKSSDGSLGITHTETLDNGRELVFKNGLLVAVNP